MTINTFVTLFSNKKRTHEEEDFVKEHIKNVYVPLEEKQTNAKAIISSTYYEKHKGTDGNETTALKVNSLAKYMYTCLTTLKLYTDLEIDYKKGLEQYNKLQECGAIDLFIRNIDQRELKEFNMVLDCEANDVFTNEYESHAFVKNQIERFGNLIGIALAPVLAGLDLSKVEEVIKRVK